MGRGATTTTSARRSLGRDFRWLWGAFAVSTVGTFVAFDAFPLIAIRALHAGPAQVSALAAVGLAVGALVAVPLGPWVEGRRKRPVMIAMDLVRTAALATVPAAFALGWLTFAQLLVVAVVTGAADIAFRAASGAYLKGLIQSEDLLVAGARFESTTWTATAVGPPLGGAAIGALGVVTTVVVNAVSFLLSAIGLRAIGPRDREPAPVVAAPRLRAGDVLEGWRTILAHPVLRRLFCNAVLVNALILATAPLLAVLMLRDLGFAPWQYGLAFGLPCVGGLLGSRLSRRSVARFGEERVLRVGGTLRACWSIGLAFVVSGAPGLALVLVVQLGLVTSVGLFNPVLVAVRLREAPTDRVARVLAAWSITSNLTIAAMTAAWGVLASAIGPRPAIALAGALMLATPVLLPRWGAARDASEVEVQPEGVVDLRHQVQRDDRDLARQPVGVD